MPSLHELLQASAALHRHLCPRQVLGVRMGLLAGELLEIAVPQPRKRLYTIAETDGCATSGLSVATNCWVGRRTLRIEDYGKVAATFIDTYTERAIRIRPHPEARARAADYAAEGRSRWERQLLGYQRMPVEKLLLAQPVMLTLSVTRLISRPGVRVLCEQCGEEIMNEREQHLKGKIFCRACAEGGYYTLLE